MHQDTLIAWQDVDERTCNDGSGPAHEAAGRVRLRQHLNDRQLVAALQVPFSFLQMHCKSLHRLAWTESLYPLAHIQLHDEHVAWLCMPRLHRCSCYQAGFVMQPFEDRSLMIFNTVLDAFDGFEDADTTRRFHNRLRDVTGSFCCINEQPRGNVFYDMWYDVVPHTDRFGREFKGKWHPILGP
jgi:hypothetical protein